MKKYISCLILILLWSCEFPDFRPKPPSFVFTEFEDIRLNIYLDSSLDPSYRNVEEWGINLSYYNETFNIPLNVVKSDASEDFDYLIFAPFPASLGQGTYKGVIDYGNGDIDSLVMVYSLWYRLSYNDDVWVDKIWIEGDSLARGDNFHFEYFKE